MGDRSVSTLLTALKLDEHPLINQFMYVEELSNADASFILSVLIKHQVEQNQQVVLVLCHNSLGHYHSISQKLGYNLISLKESGHIYVIDILEKISNEDFLMSTEPLKKLYTDIKKQLDAWVSKEGTCIVTENLGNFLLVDAEHFLTFINYLRVIALEQKNSSFILSLHNFPDSLNFNKITKSLRHLADLAVTLNDLQTGRAVDITGYLTVKRKEKNYSKSMSEYHYQLHDKSISVFIPGSKDFH